MARPAVPDPGCISTCTPTLASASPNLSIFVKSSRRLFRGAMFLRVLVLCLLLLHGSSAAFRTWTCKDGKCGKELVDSRSEAISLQQCKLTCLPYAALLPVPTQLIEVSKTLLNVDVSSPAFSVSSDVPSETSQLLTDMQSVFLTRLQQEAVSVAGDTTHSLLIRLQLRDTNTTYFAYGVNETYSLAISAQSDGENKQVEVEVRGDNVLGVRHGLETLAQLIVYDDLHEVHLMPDSANISDAPAYPHRGLNLDTARSYFPVNIIKKILDGMAQNKLNSFHWHMTDTHSFPYVSNAYPVLSDAGAYSAKQIYTAADISSVVDYARIRGIRVTPELDAPAHVGEGWVALDKDLITCFSWEPWTSYCVEPPCGQFDPTNERLYPILGTIYQEWAQLFKSDLFHMGGDEVNFNCWKSTPRIVEWMTAHGLEANTDGFIALWDKYQNSSYAQLKAVNPGASPIMWTSTLTSHQKAAKVLDPAQYIIQIWTKKDDPTIADLVKKNFRLIFTNYDELYFDCGGAAWIGGPGQNWCSPYVGWQSVYGHDPITHVQNLGVTITEQIQQLLLGSEATIWTEELDENMIEGRYWPRGAALAEKLWTRPSWGWEEAQYRMNNHRDRMVRNGARAELLQPQWCYQNDGFCGTGL